MIEISYNFVVLLISILWLIFRFAVWLKAGTVNAKREVQLLLVYICIIVSSRFTFFPFAKIDGAIQPLIFDAAKAFPPRINLVPFVNLLDYHEKREIYLNIIGNTAMFIPMGIVWPSVYKKLDTHKKVIAAGIGFSLAIELVQLPFFDRVTDIDDLILNTAGYLIGYGLYITINFLKSK